MSYPFILQKRLSATEPKAEEAVSSSLLLSLPLNYNYYETFSVSWQQNQIKPETIMKKLFYIICMYVCVHVCVCIYIYIYIYIYDYQGYLCILKITLKKEVLRVILPTQVVVIISFCRFKTSEVFPLSIGQRSILSRHTALPNLRAGLSPILFSEYIFTNSLATLNNLLFPENSRNFQLHVIIPTVPSDKCSLSELESLLHSLEFCLKPSPLHSSLIFFPC